MATDNLTHLAAFAAVARHRSFRKAGAELALSTSAVSYAIRALEERLGVGLFHRTTRSVALTEAASACSNGCSRPWIRCMTRWRK